MTFRRISLRLFLWSSIFLVRVSGCNPGDTSAHVPPSLLLDGLNGITIWMEVSGDQETYVVKESYDKTDNIARLEYYNDEDKKVYYLHVDRQNNITLLYRDDKCSVTSTKDAYKLIPFMKKLLIHDLPESVNGHPGFIGPASIFEELISNPHSYEFGRIDACTFDTKIPCNKYRVCREYQREYDYYFTAEPYELFGRKESQPLMLDVGSTQVRVLNIERTNDSLNLFVPTGIMCSLRVPEDKEFLRADNLELDAEIVVRTRDLNQTYISQFHLVYVESHHGDKPVGLYSYSYSDWKPNDTAGIGSSWTAYNRYRVVYDNDHHLEYIHQDKPETNFSTTCERLEMNKNFKPLLYLLRQDTVDLTDLFFERPGGNDPKVTVAFLGKNMVGLINVEVFEVTYHGYITGKHVLTNLVVTHYMNGEEPLALDINAFDNDGKVFTANVHVSQSNLDVVGLNEKMRIDDCYELETDKSLYRWFQVGFQLLNTDDFLTLQSVPGRIKEEYMKELFEHHHIQPIRVPQISVDFVGEQVRINTLLLETPLIGQRFSRLEKHDIRNPSKQLGVVTIGQCMRSCLALNAEQCTAVSYCGSTCVLSNASSPTAPINSLADDSCTIYERISDDDNDHEGYPVSAGVLLHLRKDAEGQNNHTFDIQFTVETEPGQSVKMHLRADSFDDTKDFESVFHYNRNEVHILETAFQIAASKRRYNPTDGGPKRLGSFSTEDCATACHNRDDCESFSYCASNQDCVISKSHDVVETTTSPDTQCVIYQLKYLDRFDKFDGLTIEGTGKHIDVGNAESCAQNCVADEDCKSFDYCGVVSDCILYKKHIVDTSKGDVAEQPTCAHYSKRYLYDYGKRLQTAGAEGSILEEIYEVSEATCAKRCSEWASADTTCLSFDFCRTNAVDTHLGLGTCRLRTISGKGKTEGSNTCDFHHYKGKMAKKVTLHEPGTTFGLSILMIFVGLGIGIGGVFVYSRFYN